MTENTHFPIITKDGFKAILTPDGSGVALKFIGLALGSGLYTPSEDQEALRSPLPSGNPHSRVKIVDHEKDGPRIKFRVVIDSDATEFDIGEIGFMAQGQDGREILFAIYSRPDKFLNRKVPGKRLTLNHNLVLSNIPSDRITVEGVSVTHDTILLSEYTKLSAEVLRLQSLVMALSNDVSRLKAGV